MEISAILRHFFLFLLVPLGTVIAIAIAKTWISEDFRKRVGTIPKAGSKARYLLECMYCLCGWATLIITFRHSLPFLSWLFGNPRFGMEILGFDILLIFDFLLRWGILWGACMVFYLPFWMFLDRAKPKRHIQRSSGSLSKSRVLHPELYDLIIIGGGIVGTAIAFIFSRFVKGVERVLLIEKNSDVATVNSNTPSNAQTAHGGDTETNFSLKKALEMRDAEHFLSEFLEKYCDAGTGDFSRLYKMAFGVGEKEVKLLKDRFDLIGSYYPTLELLDTRETIANIEPKLLEGRDSNIPVAALYRRNGYAVDYHKVAKRFAEQAIKSGKTNILLNTKTRKIISKEEFFEVRTSSGIYKAKKIAVAAGPFSLLMARDLGYATDYTMLPVKGFFYWTRAIQIAGKVYPPQDPMFPFARVHMDRSVDDPTITRFGPTAIMVPFLEWNHWLTFIDWIKSGIISRRGIYSIIKIFTNKKVFFFALRNIVYMTPYFGKRSFLEAAKQNLVPTLKIGDLHFAKGEGGIRPQLVNMKTGELEMGVGKIPGKDIVFDVTPSPGASDCLRNALINAVYLTSSFENGNMFDVEAFESEFPGIKDALDNVKYAADKLAEKFSEKNAKAREANPV